MPLLQPILNCFMKTAAVESLPCPKATGSSRGSQQALCAEFQTCFHVLRVGGAVGHYLHLVVAENPLEEHRQYMAERRHVCTFQAITVGSCRQYDLRV